MPLPRWLRSAGRGGTANLEAVLALKPDVIMDVGSVDATYVSLADRVQAQTGIPYLLIDGASAHTPMVAGWSRRERPRRRSRRRSSGCSTALTSPWRSCPRSAGASARHRSPRSRKPGGDSS